jgi:hypothetical protein
MLASLSTVGVKIILLLVVVVNNSFAAGKGMRGTGGGLDSIVRPKV